MRDNKAVVQDNKAFRIVLATGNRGKASEIAEILRARGGLSGRLEVLTIKEAVGYVPDVVEDGLTLGENARKKMDAAKLALGGGTSKQALGGGPSKQAPAAGPVGPALEGRHAGGIKADIIVADDSGLFVDCLGGRPGIHSARYGTGLSDNKPETGAKAPLQATQTELLLEEIRLANEELSSRRNREGSSPQSGFRGASFKCHIAIGYPDGSNGFAEGECRGEIAESPSGVNGFGYDPIFYLPDFNRTMAELSKDEKNAVSHRGMAIRRMADDIDLRLSQW